MEQTDSGVKATIVRNENVDEFILRHEDGTEQRSTESIGSFTYDNGDGEYTLIAVVGGNEEVIRSTTVVGAESGEKLSGTADATVDIQENGNSGEYVFTWETDPEVDGASISLYVNGELIESDLSQTETEYDYKRDRGDTNVEVRLIDENGDEITRDSTTI
jgi:hypothetical protein